MNSNQDNPFPPFMPVDPSILGVLKPGNRVMVSYPRTGSNWLKRALNSLIDSELKENANTHPDLPDLYNLIPYNKDIRMVNGPRIVKTHSWDDLPPSLVVYVTRSLEDTMISYWTFAKRSDIIDDKLTMESFVKGNLVNAVNHHERLLHEVSSGKHKIIVTSFERMQSDQARELRRVAAVLDIPVTEASIQKAIDDTEWNAVASKMKPQQKVAIWRGRSGSGAEIFSPELLEEIRNSEAGYLPRVQILLDQETQ